MGGKRDKMLKKNKRVDCCQRGRLLDKNNLMICFFFCHRMTYQIFFEAFNNSTFMPFVDLDPNKKKLFCSPRKMEKPIQRFGNISGTTLTQKPLIRLSTKHITIKSVK